MVLVSPHAAKLEEEITKLTYPTTCENGNVPHDCFAIFFINQFAIFSIDCLPTFFKYRRFDKTKLHPIQKSNILNEI